MKKTVKNIIAFILFLGALLAFIVCASHIVMPKRYELGANWGAFNAEQPHTMDVVYFGSSMVYCNIIPAIIWEDSGLSSYVMAGPEQTAAVTYYYVEEMFRSQSPQAVLVEASSILYSAATGQDAIKVNLGYMPFGPARLKATFNAAPREQWPGLLFPLYNYHDRWTELTEDDWRLGIKGYGPDPLSGYDFLDEVKPLEGPKQRGFEQTEEEYAANLGWLRKIAELCEKNDCRCIFYITGSYAYFADDYLARMRADLTRDNQAEFINCMEDLDEMGLDGATDFHDVLHFNYRGAEKYSHYLSAKLAELGIEPREPYADADGWRADLEHFRALIAESEASPPAE